MLDAAADHRVVHAGGDQRGGEVDGLLGGAALAVDGGGGRLDRQALLQPGVAGDVEALLAELLHAAGDHVFDLGGVDAGARDDLAVALAEQRVGVGVLVVALLLVPAPDRRAHGLDDHDLAALWLPHVGSPPERVCSGVLRIGSGAALIRAPPSGLLVREPRRRDRWRGSAGRTTTDWSSNRDQHDE